MDRAISDPFLFPYGFPAPLYLSQQASWPLPWAKGSFWVGPARYPRASCQTAAVWLFSLTPTCSTPCNDTGVNRAPGTIIIRAERQESSGCRAAAGRNQQHCPQRGAAPALLLSEELTAALLLLPICLSSCPHSSICVSSCP